jgi:Uma2 family endonuclease
MPAIKLDRVWTREEVLALPDDGNRYELVDGILLVSPSPRYLHQRAVGVLFRHLDAYLVAHPFGTAMTSPADLDLRTSQVMQPDVFVLDGVGDREWKTVGVPLLVAEVLSPSYEEYDREIKRRRFQRSGVPIYWIVDVDHEVFEVWTPEATAARVISDHLEWKPKRRVPPLRIDLPEFFRDVHQRR